MHTAQLKQILAFLLNTAKLTTAIAIGATVYAATTEGGFSIDGRLLLGVVVSVSTFYILMQIKKSKEEG